MGPLEPPIIFTLLADDPTDMAPPFPLEVILTCTLDFNTVGVLFPEVVIVSEVTLEITEYPANRLDTVKDTLFGGLRVTPSNAVNKSSLVTSAY
jgi:hypothetical protein